MSLDIYINNESIIFITPCFYQFFFFKIVNPIQLLYGYTIQATILYMSVQATICAGLENIFF